MDVLADVLERAAGVRAQQRNDSPVNIVNGTPKCDTSATDRR